MEEILKKYPRVLIISHNLYDKSNNIGKTLVSLLAGWPKENISELYFSNDSPSFEFCSNYFQILDKDVLYSLFSRKQAGVALNLNEHVSCNASEGKALGKLHSIGNRRISFVSAIRDFVWKVGKWKTKKLISWLKEVSKPDLILFVPNDYNLAYDAASFVLNVCNVPIVPFYMDDAFYYGCRTTLIDWLRRKSLRKHAKKINNKSKFLFTICDAMSKEYECLFNKKCYAFINSIKLNDSLLKNDSSKKNNLKFVYSGNLHSNRWKSLLFIARSLEKINNEFDTHHELTIVTASNIENKVLKRIERHSLINLKRKVSNDELKNIQFSADVLVYSESFKNKDINNLRLSMSTKIPEYFRCSTPIFAYGPQKLASMQYFKNNELAFVCENKRDIRKVLLKVISDEELRKKYAQKGLIESLKYNIDVTSKEFQKKLLSSINNEVI